MEKEITPEVALKNLAFVVEKHFRGTKDEHIALQESITVLDKLVNPTGATVVAE